jgi:hypothetical protein
MAVNVASDAIQVPAIFWLLSECKLRCRPSPTAPVENGDAGGVNELLSIPVAVLAVVRDRC